VTFLSNPPICAGDHLAVLAFTTYVASISIGSTTCFLGNHRIEYQAVLPFPHGVLGIIFKCQLMPNCQLSSRIPQVTIARVAYRYVVDPSAFTDRMQDKQHRQKYSSYQSTCKMGGAQKIDFQKDQLVALHVYSVVFLSFKFGECSSMRFLFITTTN